MLFKRSEGLTPSERLLAELCDRSFLKLWTYPNLFKKPSKELTDLLVVFGNDVLVFSDKSCAFPLTGDSMLDWSRWFRRSVAHSAHQVDQAERWLRTYPDQVFLDTRCAEPLPIRLPPLIRPCGQPRISRHLRTNSPVLRLLNQRSLPRCCGTGGRWFEFPDV